MKRRFFLVLGSLALIGFLFSLIRIVPTSAEEKKYKIAWSVWTGWMPFKIIKEKGILANRAKELGVSVELVEFKGYMDSVQAFAAGKVDGCAMTGMEALQPGASGIEVVSVLINDVSNGGDGVLVRNDMDFKSLKGQSVLLEEFSVSHYLLARALSLNGLKESDIKIKNTPGDDAGKAFLTDENVKAVATWNPHLFLAEEGGKGKILFNSTQIPGEIVDMVVINGKVFKENPSVAQAIVSAWYDAMDMIESRTNYRSRKEAVEIMASGAGATVAEFEKMLKGTILYTDHAKCIEFLEGQTLKDTMEKVKQFSLSHGLINDAQVSIRFDSSFVKADSQKRQTPPKP